MPTIKGHTIDDARFGYEIDFLPVGEESKSGDAIAIRWGDLHSCDPDRQRVVVVDGGTVESGENLVKHLADFYHTDSADLLVLTHPDGDHASGPRVVIDKLAKVGRIWMHQPWNYSQAMMALINDGRVSNQSLKSRWQEDLSFAWEIAQLARQKQIPIEPMPFAGCKEFDVVTILGPSEEYYKKQLAAFDATPSNAIKEAAAKALAAARQAIRWIDESIRGETLVDPALDAVSAENNSSIIMLLHFPATQPTFKGLLTGDAGDPAMREAINFAVREGVGMTDLDVVQMPHHGSKHNIGPTILNYLFGEPGQQHVHKSTAYISAAPKGDPRHPSRKLVNALNRRSVTVCTTGGEHLLRQHNNPLRQGYGPAKTLGAFAQVEDYSE